MNKFSKTATALIAALAEAAPSRQTAAVKV